VKILFDRKTKPEAYAKIKGDGNHPKITGRVSFFEVYGGTVVSVEVKGLHG
jgi:Cu-Zn family superoxide dismutase